MNSVRRLIRSSTLQPLTPDFKPHPCRKFGWFWGVTEQVDFLTSELSARGKVVYVWDTPQFKAIEWLTRQDRLRFPPDLDLGLHGAFCKILSMEAICREPLLQGDIVEAMEQIKKASKKLVAAADHLFAIQPEVLKALDVAPQRYTSTLGAAQAAYSGGLGDMGGFLSAELNFRERVLARFGGPTDGATGRPSNWVARLIAMHAADIYRTTLPGDIVKADGRPSFEGFLERFSVSFPDAERADKRELARSVWKGTYKGTPFAPVSDAIPQRGGVKLPKSQ